MKMSVRGFTLPEAYSVNDTATGQTETSAGHFQDDLQIQCSVVPNSIAESILSQNIGCDGRQGPSQAASSSASNIKCVPLPRKHEAYFKDALEFLHRYSWVYDFQVTEFLTAFSMDKFPQEWQATLANLSWMDLNELPYIDSFENIPESLAEYLNTCRRLSLPRQVEESNLVSRPNLPGMNPKKSHEIFHLAELVNKVVSASKCPLIVDVGAGLGYLSTLLAKEYGREVLALECRDYLTHGTEKRSNEQDASFLEAVTFRVEDNQKCSEELQKIVRDKLQTLDSSHGVGSIISPAGQETSLKAPGAHCQGDEHSASDSSISGTTVLSTPGACMIGLHCCGSLTPTMLKLFLSSQEFTSLVCVSCCYHGMEKEGDSHWKHFPLSHCLKEAWTDILPSYEMSVFGLRLGAQETRARWRKQTEADHTYHSNNMGFRALLEIVCDKDGLDLQKNKRRITRKKDMSSIASFAEGVIARTNLQISPAKLAQRLQEEYAQNKTALDLVESFTALQVCMQSAIESLVLIDRLTFLREAGVQAVLVPIFDEDISPRNMALVAVKTP